MEEDKITVQFNMGAGVLEPPKSYAKNPARWARITQGGTGPIYQDLDMPDGYMECRCSDGSVLGRMYG